MKNAPVEFEIIQVANGWMLREFKSYRQVGDAQRTWVFTTVGGMTSWMTQNLKEPSNERQD
jgi:hypothetical protein